MSRKSLVFLLLFWTASPALAEEPLPIWLNEEFFGIARIEDYETRLHQPFPVDPGPYHLNLEGRPRRILRNCANFLAANAEGVRLWDLEHAYEATSRMLMVCYGLKYLKWARPAARSFVREDLLAGSLPDLFPSSFDATINCQASGYELGKEAEWPDLSWQAEASDAYGFDAREFFFPIGADRDRAVILYHFIFRIIITALARADFDGDGLEDVLLHMEIWNLDKYPGTHQYRYGPPTEMAILTRAAPGGRFRTLYTQTGEFCFHFNLAKWKDSVTGYQRQKADQFRPPYKVEDLGSPVR